MTRPSRYESEMKALFGPNEWHAYTVLLEDGTTGTLQIPADMAPEEIVGAEMNIELSDENGMKLFKTGIVAEILE